MKLVRLLGGGGGGGGREYSYVRVFKFISKEISRALVPPLYENAVCN